MLILLKVTGAICLGATASLFLDKQYLIAAATIPLLYYIKHSVDKSRTVRTRDNEGKEL